MAKNHINEAIECWQCGARSEESLFCEYCNSLQEPRLDYYKFLGIERRLCLDEAVLKKRFYDLSRLLHPDHYTLKAGSEQQYSLEATAILNDAYRTLRDPVSRAEYFLKQSGFEPSETRSKNVDPELLEEVFELNMALEQLRNGDHSARPELEVARDKFLAMRAEIDRDLQDLFEEYDASKDDSLLAAIRSLLDRRCYIQNLVAEVGKELVA